MRRAFALALTISVAVAAVDLAACGDKFLRVGRSARFRRYAAVYPASILIYTPAGATTKGMKEFETLLKRAGHKPIAVNNGTSIGRALASARYDLVIADYADAARIKNDLQSVASKPELLPILYKPTPAVEAQAKKEYVCLIKPHAMTKYDALAEIDRLMQLKMKDSSEAIATELR